MMLQVWQVSISFVNYASIYNIFKLLFYSRIYFMLFYRCIQLETSVEVCSRSESSSHEECEAGLSHSVSERPRVD